MFNKAAKFIFTAFLIWLFIHLFFFQVLYVPTVSMVPTLNEGDYIVVNKLSYGARLPITPLSLPFGGSRVFLDWLKLPYLRLPGLIPVRRNDLMVFNLPAEQELPVDERKLYVKRCVALPGDTFAMDSGRVFIDHRRLTYANEKKDSFLADKNTFNPNVFPNHPFFRWNLDFFGPVVIPQMGKSVKLTVYNIYLYKKIIEYFESNKLEIRNSSVYINGRQAESYTFKMNYYFTLGDNRHNSIDSRTWGFVPENHIVGKVIASYTKNLL
jgi:signal peptidase I